MVENPQFKELCRLCATKIRMASVINIFEPEGTIRQISKKICTCLPIQVHKMDKLPKNICGTCMIKLDLFYDFRESSARSERLFEELYKEFTTVHADHKKKIIVPLDHNELVAVQQHQILNEASGHLTRLGQDEDMIVKQEIILTHDRVELNSIDLIDHDLSDQDRSNQSFQTLESIMIDSEPESNQDPLFTVDTVNVIQHQLSDRFRLQQQDIDVNMVEVNSENDMQLTLTVNDICDTEQQIQKDDFEVKIECDEIKLEDESLLVDSHLNNIQVHDSCNKEVDPIVENLKQDNTNGGHCLLVNEEPNNVSVLNCNICGKKYEQKSEFDEHSKTHLYKCGTCLTVFTNADILNSHRKEALGPCVKDTKAESSRAQNGGNRKRRDRKDYCLFCKNYVSNFARHMIRNHSKEKEVRKIMTLSPNDKTRKKLLSNLRNKGNFLNNPKPMRRGTTTHVLPCTNCLGYYSAKLLSRHRRACMGTSDRLHQVKGQNFLLKDLNVDQQLKDKVFLRMRPDEISMKAKTDELICAFGARYFKKRSKQHFVNVTSRKMRELARLLIEIQKLEPSIKSLIEALRSANFEILVSATKIVTQYNEEDGSFESASTALNLGSAIRQCCHIAIVFVLEGRYVHPTLTLVEADADLKALIKLIDSKWRFEISKKASIDLNTKKLNKIPDTVPQLPCKASTSPSELRQNMVKKSGRILIPWTDQQKEVVRLFFATHIKNNLAPKKHECLVLKDKYAALLNNKDWLKIKVFVQNEYVKRNR